MFSAWPTPTADYIDRVFNCVAWQIASNGDKLPAYFVIPPPSDAAQLEDVHDILTDFCMFEFDNARLPEIHYQGVPHTKQ
jgi:hypothetical protein